VLSSGESWVGHNDDAFRRSIPIPWKASSWTLALACRPWRVDPDFDEITTTSGLEVGEGRQDLGRDPSSRGFRSSTLACGYLTSGRATSRPSLRNHVIPDACSRSRNAMMSSTRVRDDDRLGPAEVLYRPRPGIRSPEGGPGSEMRDATRSLTNQQRCGRRPLAAAPLTVMSKLTFPPRSAPTAEQQLPCRAVRSTRW
jgi:hypothetical protein